MNQSLFNTIKISVATYIAIMMAELLGLEFSVAAGIVAILSIAQTKKDTIKTACNRFFAFIVALLIAYVAYSVFGYNLIGFCVYVFFFILICQHMQWHSAMAMNSVLISHFISLGKMDVAGVLNELLLFAIGVSLGILANLHLRKNVDYMEKMKGETDTLIQNTLGRMAQRILHKDLKNYNGECFEALNQSIREAKDIAKINYMNQIGVEDKSDMEYISMRQKQVFLLTNMYKRVSVLRTTPITAEKIANYLVFVSENFNQDEVLEDMRNQFYNLDSEFKITALPIKRKEFEDRANLYSLMRDMEEFLNIKYEFINKEEMTK